MKRWLVLMILTPFASWAKAGDIEPAHLFQAYQTVCRADSGELWEQSLCGPVLLADHENGRVYANGPDADGYLAGEDGVWTGSFQDENAPVRANTAADWSGTRWAVIMWPLGNDDLQNALRLLAHESFHRIESSLPFVPKDQPFSSHLDEEKARLWLRLELRALAAALKNDADEAVAHFANALRFRAERYRPFPGAEEPESKLEMMEGLAEYTGWAVVPDDAKQGKLARLLLSRETTGQFARSFAYQTGPAYGLFFDRLLPDWKAGLTDSTTFPDLARQAIGARAHREDRGNAEDIAKPYGYVEVAAEEATRAEDRARLFALYRKRFVEGPRLIVPFANGVDMTFDPNHVTALGDHGQVYRTVTLKGPWGTLKATGGALLDWSNGIGVVDRIGTPAGPLWKTDGWRLELAPGWILEPDGDDFKVSREKSEQK